MTDDFDLLKEAKRSSTLVSELREKAQASLYFLTKAILGFKDLTPHLHQEVAREVQDITNNPFLLVLLPRKHCKSTISTIGFPIWIHIQEWIPLLDQRGSDIRILIANESATNAEHFLSIIEQLWEGNELLRLLFPEIAPEPAGRKRWNAKEMLLNREAKWPEASVETIGVGGAAQSRHYDIRILDDLIGKEAMDSEVTMEKAVTWYDYSESLSISPTRSVCRVLGTRWSRRDLYQHIMDKDKKFKVYTRQCIEGGQPIFPEWYTTAYYDELRIKNPAHYMSQYCNNPSDPSKCDFKEDWIKHYTWETKADQLFINFSDDSKPVNFRELDIVGVFDPSIDERPTASLRAIVYVGADSKQRMVVLETYASRDSMDKVLDAIFSLYAKWHPRVFGVEAVALSRVYIPLIEKECQLRKKWISASAIKVSTQKSKDSRIRDAIQQVASQGRLYVQSTMREFYQEFIDFPQGRTKDILDATAHCINLLSIPDSLEDQELYELLEEDFLKGRSEVTGY